MSHSAALFQQKNVLTQQGKKAGHMWARKSKQLRYGTRLIGDTPENRTNVEVCHDKFKGQRPSILLERYSSGNQFPDRYVKIEIKLGDSRGEWRCDVSDMVHTVPYSGTKTSVSAFVRIIGSMGDACNRNC